MIAKYATNKYGSLLVIAPKKSLILAKAIPMYTRMTWEPYNVKLIEEGKYDIYVDVGAAVGYFTRIAGHHCKKVIAYEANPFRFGLLLTNTRDLFNVDCRYKYVTYSKKDIPKMAGAFDMIGLAGTTKCVNDYNIECVTLDEELLDLITPDDKVLIKMDVQGNDLKVLDGAKELIKNKNVHWSIDVHSMAPWFITEKQISEKLVGKTGRTRYPDGRWPNLMFYS